MLKDKLKGILEYLRVRYGLDCDLSYSELISYLTAESYERDKVSVEQILKSDLYLIHEVSEACIIKRLGYKLNREVILRAYPKTYEAHLKAMEIELKEALDRGFIQHLRQRCKDLNSYLEDPLLPRNLKPLVFKLTNKYCKPL